MQCRNAERTDVLVAESKRGGEPTVCSGTVRVDRTCYGIDQQGGKGGANYLKDICPTILSDSHGTPHAVCYAISPFASNAMMSKNPRAGIYKAETARTLDLNGGNPACNQGGVLVLCIRTEAERCR